MKEERKNHSLRANARLAGLTRRAARTADASTLRGDSLPIKLYRLLRSDHGRSTARLAPPKSGCNRHTLESLLEGLAKHVSPASLAPSFVLGPSRAA